MPLSASQAGERAQAARSVPLLNATARCRSVSARQPILSAAGRAAASPCGLCPPAPSALCALLWKGGGPALGVIITPCRSSLPLLSTQVPPATKQKPRPPTGAHPVPESAAC